MSQKDSSEKDMKNNQKKYTLLKYVNSSYLSERTVILDNIQTLGRCIFIKSKNGIQKSKNIIQVFNYNPITQIYPTINGKLYICALIKRQNGESLIITSENDILIELFINDINEWVIKTREFRNMLHRWCNCIQNNIVRVIYSIHMQKKIQEVNRKLKNKHHDEIIHLHARYNIACMKYLSYNLTYGPNGYKFLEKHFFKLWKREWKNQCLRENIKYNHGLIKYGLNFFTQTKNDNMNDKCINKRFFHNLHDNNIRTTKIDRTFSEIISSFEKVISHGKALDAYTEENKIEIVRNLQKIADLRHHIQTITNEGEEFILIGDQSSGKSSLLCMLLGVNISYTDDTFATRCPVRYLLEPCEPHLGWKYEFENTHTREFTSVSQEELQKRLIHHFKKNIGKHIVFEPITIKVYSPVCTSSMTLVDLPGLVGLGDATEKREQHEASYSIVKDYLKRPNIFVLFVHRFDVDIGSLNTKILEEVNKKCNDNVIYCITHFDRYCTDKDISIDDVYNNILSCSDQIARGKDMFLLSLSKKVEDLGEKEMLVQRTITVLREEHLNQLSQRNVHFNIDSIKLFLRKKIHKHIIDTEKIIYNYVQSQRKNLGDKDRIISKTLKRPEINEWVLDSFMTNFKNKTHKLLKGHFIPDKNSNEHIFFENLDEEINNANNFSINTDVPVWPNVTMPRKTDICGNKKNFNDKLDISLKRDLVSHALFTRTIYELQMRLCSINLIPNDADIKHGITADPNINLDVPKDSAHCVMVHTVQQQLNMSNFFDYTIKRLEYIIYKIVRYVVWSILNSPETPYECLLLFEKSEFQSIFETEIYKFVNKLSVFTRKEMTSIFDEIMSAPIVMGHAIRYKEMLIRDYGWSDEEINRCIDNSIFQPRHIDVHNDDDDDALNNEENTRITKIQQLIKLHIHVRMIMISEHIVHSIDYNWRRMLDDSKESAIYEKSSFPYNLYDHIRANVCKKLNIDGDEYDSDVLYKLYTGNQELLLKEYKDKVNESYDHLNTLIFNCEKLPDLMFKSIQIAGNRFL